MPPLNMTLIDSILQTYLFITVSKSKNQQLRVIQIEMESTTQKPEPEMSEAQHGLPHAPPDNDDLFSLHSDKSADQWMAPDLSQLHDHTQALHEPLQPLVEEFEGSDQGYSQQSQQVTDISRPYSTFCESYAAKVVHIQHLEKENEIIRTSNTQLCQQLHIMERRQANQEALLVCYAKIFHRVREEILRVLNEGESISLDPTLATIENPTNERR
ncbi:uncharacterized protein N7496_006055 [Penicillium cataractarum]|uniref:Uncharacterized protein n=1 Tax=Penicillium cataractarum TaxID=2100454 RepID=A0A9W9S0V9_9EURO|nr:uncharacterized protein N7496_006055 [Penicillium cataractarum]KAJ5369963.1 hypothetical protein N7496_006055 [Penicillium cataractarum]